ncbi:hypothetical protein PVK06_007967 [Gossypium arboreum]|uniref:RNase H type-1 domain-containing protein n=1 Tax=Gossypium arboreum TaxID=29729 RepID=A0ABR0QJZ2_GOSAR|nr:hypothetical protein PVK06_007967 [Gossypium arboreum]
MDFALDAASVMSLGFMQFEIVPSQRRFGWIKLNMDGVVSPSRSFASIGGVFRYMNGSWLCGFLMRLGEDIIFKVEAKAILKGLNLAWDKGFRQLELECDNALLVETILVGGVADSNMTELRLIYRLLNWNWKYSSYSKNS